ncbi:hypothetical protein SDC9_172111 [bioreactor metagenome]|uniref:Uncharacterized protein n=1 Tax=bioreactor metagenome TaxID=1076179 RepID=A0A645GG04_9ZZZZ
MFQLELQHLISTNLQVQPLMTIKRFKLKLFKIRKKLLVTSLTGKVTKQIMNQITLTITIAKAFLMEKDMIQLTYLSIKSRT